MTDYSVINIVEEREAILFVLWDGTQKALKRMPFLSYFFVLKSDGELYEKDFVLAFGKEYALSWVNAKNCDANGPANVDYMRIETTNNFMRVKLRNWWEDRGVKTYEADIKANKRFLINNPDVPLHASNLNYTFIDIETDDRKPLRKDKDGVIIADASILSFSAVDSTGAEVSFVNEGTNVPEERERDLLVQIGEYLQKYCIALGWNSSKFDIPYIKQRMEIHAVPFNWEHIVELDFMELFKKNFRHSLPSYKLNAVAKSVVGEEKLDHPKGNGNIYNSWVNTRDHLIEYNLQDSRLLKKINERLQFVELHKTISDLAHCLMRETLQNSLSMDVLLMIEYRQQNIVMPSKPTREEMDVFEALGSIGGGYTTCLKKGLHRRVEIFDYKSMYPSVIITWNISPETMFNREMPECIVTPDDWNEDTGGRRYHPKRYFSRDKGVVPTVLQRLIDERDKTKYSMKQFLKTEPAKYQQMYLHQYALKVLANSVYGILSFSRSRYYSFDLGDSVTSCCRALTKSCYAYFESVGGIPIGGDTDSVFVSLPEGMTNEECDKQLAEYIDSWLKQWNITAHCIVFEHEKTVGPMLFVMKKNYAYLCEAEKSEKNPLGLTLKGLECVKSDANPLAAKLQKEFVIGMLTDKIEVNAWMTRMMDEYTRCVDMKLTTAEVTMSKELTKPAEEYGGYTIDKKTKKPKVKKDGTLQARPIPAHVKLAQRMAAEGHDIAVGMKIHYVVVGQKPLEIVSADTHKGEYDALYYWTRLVKPSVKVMAASGLGFDFNKLGVPRKVLVKYVSAEDDGEEDEDE